MPEDNDEEPENVPFHVRLKEALKKKAEKEKEAKAAEIRVFEEGNEEIVDGIGLLRSQIILRNATPASALTKPQRAAIKVQKGAIRKMISENINALVDNQIALMEIREESFVDILTLI